MEEIEAAEIAFRIFDKIKNYFWVVAYPNKVAYGPAWAFGPDRPPKPGPNSPISWRRPTFEDLIQRILLFENDEEST